MLNSNEIKSAEEMELISILADIELSAIEGVRFVQYYNHISDKNIEYLEKLGYKVWKYEGEISGRKITW